MADHAKYHQYRWIHPTRMTSGTYMIEGFEMQPGHLHLYLCHKLGGRIAIRAPLDCEAVQTLIRHVATGGVLVGSSFVVS